MDDDGLRIKELLPFDIPNVVYASLLPTQVFLRPTTLFFMRINLGKLVISTIK